jgi:hypothetical protein
VAPQQSEPPDEPGMPGERAAEDGENADTGEIRAAARSAERAAAVAAAEGFHPLRVRPYVAEPDGEPGEPTVRSLLAADPDGPATADARPFPALYSGLEYAEEASDPAYAESAEAAALAAAVRGRHRRRRRGAVIVAAAVAASALAAGAVAVSGQVMGDEQGATDRALPDLTTTMPDVTLPTDAGPATTATAAAPVTRHAAPATTSAAAATKARPTHAGTASPTESASTSVTATATATGTASPAPSLPGTVVSTPPTRPVAPPAPPVLALGDTGPAVADLQRRLTEVWVYHGPLDGVFDRHVRHAVATFQVWYWVTDAVGGGHDGVYGPHTRAALERQTSY